MGWRKTEGDSPISFLFFARWLNNNGLEEKVTK